LSDKIILSYKINLTEPLVLSYKIINGTLNITIMFEYPAIKFKKDKKTQLKSQKDKKIHFGSKFWFWFGSVQLLGKQTVNRTITLVQFG